MRILLVAAEPMEFEGVLAHAEEAQVAGLSADWARTCRLAGHDALLVANGAGRKRAASATDAGIDHWRPDAVVSTGFCGALDEKLRIAEVVVGTAVIGPGAAESGRETIPCRVPLPNGRASVAGVVYSSGSIARTVQQKRKLRDTGAVAIEMEAAGVAESAQERGLPFICVRAVTDLAGETLANDFAAALRSDGHFDTMRVLTGAFRHPSTRIPELLRLRRRCKRAARALGEFFAVCGF